MNDEISQGINPKRLKSFVRHLCVIAKKHKDREEARDGLQGQIRKLRKLSFKKKEVDKELKELDRRISWVLEKEMRLLGVGQRERAGVRELTDSVVENREKMAEVKESIKDIRGKLGDYIHEKTEREKKIDGLEKRIRARTGKKDFSLLKNKLKKLDAVYDKLKRKGVDVGKIGTRIEHLRLRLMA